jgi:response regulator RpfG family c-di-GMP phosphodiesterase
MIATSDPGENLVRSGNGALARVPQRAFGENEWVSLALESCARHLEPAIASGQPYRIANAIRAVVHVPTAEQRDAVINAVCDGLLTAAYTSRNARMVTEIAQARSVIVRVLTELDERTERSAIEPTLLRETVDGFVRMTALVDRRLAERLDATGRFAARIGAAMHLPPAAVLNIEFAGRMHDIGAIGGVSELKPVGPLSEAFLLDVPQLAHLAPIVRSHRERFDGSGFPDGLRGNEIPLESRVISVAATFVERITAAPEHEALLPQDVCHDLALHAGTHYDPDVVAATLQLLHFRQRTNRSA